MKGGLYLSIVLSLTFLFNNEMLLSQGFITGEIASWLTKGGLAQNYYVYLPSDFNKNERRPIIIAFNPQGKGLTMVYKMKEAAEERGWILVGCDFLLNGMKDIAHEEALEDEFLDDILISIPHDNKRIYLAGFSGGAIRAYGISARRSEPFAGVIAYGGWLGGLDYQDKPYCREMSVAIVNGEKDHGANNEKGNDSIITFFSF